MSEDRRKIQISRPLLPKATAFLPELEEMLASGQLTNGAQVRRFEAMVREYLGGTHEVVAVSSNTTGMLLCWKALGVRGEVLLPAFTFPATAHVLAWNGLDPVLVDCDPETFNIDLADARRKVTARTVGIAPVYIFGNPPDWEGIEAFAAEHGLKVVSDAAHGFGTRVGGRFAGTFGDAEVFSLAPTKVLTTGEGGLVATPHTDLADALRRMRNYGNPGDYNCRELGLNGRMTEIHALLGVHGLPDHERQLGDRQRLASAYRRELDGVPGLSFQSIAPGVRSTHNYFAVLLEPETFGARNDAVQRFLYDHGVESKIYFHPPIHEQALYAALAPSANVPSTHWLCERILCLPLTAHLKEEDVVFIASLIKRAPSAVGAREATS